MRDRTWSKHWKKEPKLAMESLIALRGAQVYGFVSSFLSSDEADAEHATVDAFLAFYEECKGSGVPTDVESRLELLAAQTAESYRVWSKAPQALQPGEKKQLGQEGLKRIQSEVSERMILPQTEPKKRRALWHLAAALAFCALLAVLLIPKPAEKADIPPVYNDGSITIKIEMTDLSAKEIQTQSESLGGCELLRGVVPPDELMQRVTILRLHPNGYTVLEGDSKAELVNYREDGTLRWSVPYRGGHNPKCLDLSDGVLVVAVDAEDAGEYAPNFVLSRYDADGNHIWSRKSEKEPFENINDVLALDNGGTLCVSNVNYEVLCVRYFDENGDLQKRSKQEIGGFFPRNFVETEAVRLFELFWANPAKDGHPGSEQAFFQINEDYEFDTSFAIQMENKNFLVDSVMEHAGKVYFSCTISPNEEEELQLTSETLTSEERTQLCRELYTAVLLVFNAKTMLPEYYYFVEGASAGILRRGENGEMLWDVGSIYACGLNSSLRYDGQGGITPSPQEYIFCCTFDENGEYVSYEPIGGTIWHITAG